MSGVTGKWLDPSVFEQEIPTGTVNGTNTSFALSKEPIGGKAVLLFLDILPLVQDTDYIIVGKDIEFTTAPKAGQRPFAWYMKK